MKVWGYISIIWAAVWLALAWRGAVGGGLLGLAALAFAPLMAWVWAWARRRGVRGLRAIDAEALTWEQSSSAPPR